MQISIKTLLIAIAVILALFTSLAIIMTVKKNGYDSRIVELQNELAARDQTIEIQTGVFQKLAIQSGKLQDLLDKNNVELELLKKQLDKSGAELLTATTIIAKLKKDLASAGHVTDPGVDPEKPNIATVNFDSKNDFSPFRVYGFTTADCLRKESPTAKLSFTQEKPLNISVVVSQDKDGTWRTSATSSEENFQIDIGLASVNPYMLQPRWYEKIGMMVDLAVGTNPGLLAGVGLSYQIGKFEVGPKAWVIIDRGVSPYFGAQLLWHPFQR